MKKIFALLFMFLIIASCCAFADDEADEELLSSDYTYEDYENMLSSGGYTQEELEEEYEDFLKFLADEEAGGIGAIKVYRAKVLDDAKVETYYQADEYLIYKIDYQPIEVELLEGENAGEKVNVTFFLTYDTLGNIEIPTIKRGDVIYVAESGDTTTPYKATETFLNVDKGPGIYIVATIVFIMLAIYGGRDGVLSSLISAFIFVVLMLICISLIIDGARIEWLIGLFAMCITALVSIKLCGISKEAIFVGISSLINIIIGLGITYLVDIWLRNRGTTMEITFAAETVLKRNVNFHMFYLGGIAIILSVVIPGIVKKIYDIYDNNRALSFNELLASSKNVLGNTPEIVTAILVVISLPVLLLLKGYGYSYAEIVSADMMQAEFIRLLMILFTMAFSIPMTSALCKFILQAKKEPQNNVEENKLYTEEK